MDNQLLRIIILTRKEIAMVIDSIELSFSLDHAILTYNDTLPKSKIKALKKEIKEKKSLVGLLKEYQKYPKRNKAFSIKLTCEQLDKLTNCLSWRKNSMSGVWFKKGTANQVKRIDEFYQKFVSSWL